MRKKVKLQHSNHKRCRCCWQKPILFSFIHLVVVALTLTTANISHTHTRTRTHKTQMHPTFIMIFSKLIFLKSLFIMQIFTRRKSSNRKYVAEKTDTKHPHSRMPAHIYT